MGINGKYTREERRIANQIKDLCVRELYYTKKAEEVTKERKRLIESLGEKYQSRDGG